jgi:hypothetical protein
MADSNSRIVYPTVPPSEIGPRARVNVMVEIFNANLPPRGEGVPRRAIDQGFYHEIQTARKLINEGKIRHGWQISRPLTKAEQQAGINGNSQLILVPMGGGLHRELDMVYEEEGSIHIVEAKTTKTVDHSQLIPNLELSLALPGLINNAFSVVVYALEGEKAGQEKALKEAYNKALSTLPRELALIKLKIIHVPNLPIDNFAENYYKGHWNGAASMQIGRPVWEWGNPDEGDEPDYVPDPDYC